MIKKIMFLKKFLAASSLLIFSLLLLSPLAAKAANDNINIIDKAELRDQIQNNNNNPTTFKPSIDIPGADGFTRGSAISAERVGTTTVSLLGRYIKSIYGFFVGIAAIIATFMIALGGFMWLVSGGGDNIKKAKEFIIGAIVGLVLILGSYVFLIILNPNLVRLDLAIPDVPAMILPDLGSDICSDKIGQEGVFQSGGDLSCLSNHSCRVGDQDITDAIATFDGVELKTVHPNFKSAAVLAVSSFNNEDQYGDLTGGRKYEVVIKSLRRSFENQQKLRNCYDRKEADANKVCPADCVDGCAKAAQPSCEAPHVRGVAIDLCIKRKPSNLPQVTPPEDVPDLCTFMKNHISLNELRELAAQRGEEWLNAVDDLNAVMSYYKFRNEANEWWHWDMKDALKSPATF